MRSTDSTIIRTNGLLRYRRSPAMPTRSTHRRRSSRRSPTRIGSESYTRFGTRSAVAVSYRSSLMPHSRRCRHTFRKFKQAGLVKSRKKGKWSYYRIADTAVFEVLDLAAATQEVA